MLRRILLFVAVLAVFGFSSAEASWRDLDRLMEIWSKENMRAGVPETELSDFDYIRGELSKLKEWVDKVPEGDLEVDDPDEGKGEPESLEFSASLPSQGGRNLRPASSPLVEAFR